MTGAAERAAALGLTGAALVAYLVASLDAAVDHHLAHTP